MASIKEERVQGKGFDPPSGAGSQAWLMRYLKGIIIGIGAILPGLSGAVLAVVFGLYSAIMRFLGQPFYRFKANFFFFLPLGLGGLTGILIFSFFVSAAFGAYELFFVCLFVGLVAGTVPALYREAGREGRQARDLVFLCCAACLIFVLMLGGEQQLMQVESSFLVWLLAGAGIGLGFIVPGLSPSNFLMYFGLYKKMTDAVKDLDWQIVLPLALGGVCSVLLLAKPFSYILNKAYSQLYHVILGLVIGSSLGIIPSIILPGLSQSELTALDLSLFPALVLCLLFFCLGTGASLLFAKLEKID